MFSGIHPDIALKVVSSMQALHSDGATLDPAKPKVHYAVTELRGDWKFQKEAWFFLHVECVTCMILCMISSHNNICLFIVIHIRLNMLTLT
jgi:hypothetical protein